MREYVQGKSVFTTTERTKHSWTTDVTRTQHARTQSGKRTPQAQGPQQSSYTFRTDTQLIRFLSFTIIHGHQFKIV